MIMLSEVGKTGEEIVMNFILATVDN